MCPPPLRRRSAQGYRSADELTGSLFYGGSDIVSASGAVSWEITAHRATSKEEHDKSRADYLSLVISPLI